MQDKIEIRIDDSVVDYPLALEVMEKRVEGIIDKSQKELIWLTWHDDIYTAGISANEADLLTDKLPVYRVSRGGKYTYHGRGMRMIYVMLDLKNHFEKGKVDVRQFVKKLENWMINVLARFGIKAFICEGRVGIWTKDKNGGEKKIGAIGIKLKRWVSFHGIALNLDPNLDFFKGIVPCGISEFGVTSIKDLGVGFDYGKVDEVILEEFFKAFKN